MVAGRRDDERAGWANAMLDVMTSRDDGDDDRFDRLIDYANAALKAAGEEAIGEGEEGIIADMCDDTFMTVDEVVDFIRADRTNRKATGLPSGSM
jgi:hypothetical protein